MAASPLDTSTAKPADDGRQEFFSNLDNYIRLGCIHTSRQTPSTYDGAEEWRELAVRDIPEDLALDIPNPLWKVLQKLHAEGWTRLFLKDFLESAAVVLRVYVLPHDTGRKFTDEKSRKSVQYVLRPILGVLDVSPKTWSGDVRFPPQDFDQWATPVDNSLFYLFNTLPSPSPSPRNVRNRYTRTAMEDILNILKPLRGLKSLLYPYQARTAAAMVQHEGSPSSQLDPRLESRTAPDGSVYYYGSRECSFLRHPVMYECPRGGILAETMGLGKTVICLAVILATKHHLPGTPPEHQRPPPSRPKVGSLVDMVIASANRHSVPLKSGLERRHAKGGVELTPCINAVTASPPTYFISAPAPRATRNPTTVPDRKVWLSSGTIIVVPGNLVHQWQSEIKKHVVGDEFGLKVLIIDHSRTTVPSANELLQYDIVLFSRERFRAEIMDGSDRQGRRAVHGVKAKCQCSYIGASRVRDCTCLQEGELYHSPLKDVHWLRIIIDEGHQFSSSNSDAVSVASKLVTAERRWIVSGTPARNHLFGVEVDVATNDEDFTTPSTPARSVSFQGGDDARAFPPPDTTPSDHAPPSEIQLHREVMLEQRKHFNGKEEIKGAKSIGLLASNFLQVRPFSESHLEAKLDWEQYIYRHEDRFKKTYTAFSLSLKRILDNLVIKTRPEDVEKDIDLPPLTHKIVTLEPSFYDKITANLFILVLTGNAVTSEREDADYLFHKASAKSRNSLIHNLRQSNFFWTALSESDVLSAVGNLRRYLGKPDTKCSAEDRVLSNLCLEFAESLMSVENWKALTRSHEMGIFLSNWPESSTTTWALAGVAESPIMVGLTQLLQAQSHINSNLISEDPASGLDAVGITAANEAFNETEEKDEKEPKNGEMVKKGVPTSTLATQSSRKRKSILGSKISPKKTSPLKPKPKAVVNDSKSQEQTPKPNPRKRANSANNRVQLPASSPLLRTSIAGTASAKLSYLLEKVVAYYQDEKILIFYDNGDTAFYIAQCMELLHIKHMIYARTLRSETKSKYIVTFDTDPSVRVLLMDIRCGAEGLNVNKASRVFFINPCCNPGMEAQAIKRSHRIGQTRPVHVETLILKGTIEEAMFKRSKVMTSAEHMRTAEISDDKTVARIIQNARPLEVEFGGEGERQMAGLETPQQLFARVGRGEERIEGIDVEGGAEGVEFGFVGCFDSTPLDARRRGGGEMGLTQ
ncbi:hypothetical protein K402DRAFT_450297 [Aulographum hederae CBS 113979]|uniref:Helicase C-terminal domain-containing protein n=1 Tax=Aulographum hederae CBS 113979 TaxID=1176131 RepID=A0A6G1HDN1_9PEZI|nr:hypothetical protein K402DRAFT_450297 [Aulographum hederae CBS 113979]